MVVVYTSLHQVSNRSGDSYFHIFTNFITLLLLGGSTWTKTSAPPSSNWVNIVSDSTGGCLAAVVYYGVGIYTSTSG
jgi:hypothetical protein